MAKPKQWYIVHPKTYKKDPYIVYVWAKNKTMAISEYLKYLSKGRFRLADRLREKHCTAEIAEKLGKPQIGKESK